MTSYNGFPKSIQKLTLATLIVAAIALIIVFTVTSFAMKVFLLALTLPFMHLSYLGMILKITLSENEVTIHRPLYTQRILIDDIAFCAVHGIEEGKSLVYCFTRKKFFGSGVHGIRSKESFEHIVERIRQDDGNLQTDLDINFHRAKKIPLSFVENSDSLKDGILKAVDRAHLKRR